MPTPTYTLIQEQVLASAASSVTFTSIPQTYKDLVLEMTVTTTSPGNAVTLAPNSLTYSSVSSTYVNGDGSAARSGRQTTSMTSSTAIAGFNQYLPQSASTYATINVNIQSYANTSVFKTALVRYGYASGEVGGLVSLWQTFSGITALTIGVFSSGSLAAGSTFRLYGLVG